MRKVAIITGSSGGIGVALVKVYLDDDYFVIGIDRIGRSLCAEVMATKKFVELDGDLDLFARDDNYRAKVLSTIKFNLPETMGSLVLVNNAATQILNKVADVRWEDWDRSIAVNSIAPFFLVQGLVKELADSRGHVVNISSIHSKLTKPKFTCYAASKAALESVTRSLMLELSPLGISVNAIAPAAIATDMLCEGFAVQPGKLSELEACHPSNTIGTPEGIAQFVKAITDHRSRFLTGTILEFNGGISGRLYDPE